MAGIRGRIMPALQNVAHMRDHPNPTLTDLPVRVLLGTLGRQVPDVAGLVRDLQRPLPGDGSAPAAAPAPGEKLHFSAPKNQPHPGTGHAAAWVVRAATDHRNTDTPRQ